jgi:ribosomal protein S27E
MDTPQNSVHCPKCNSTQITAHQKGFSAGKAIAGDLLLGPLGLLAGQIGRNDIIITCLNCGTQFAPGAKPIKQPKQQIQWKTLPSKNSATPGQIKVTKILGIIFSGICLPFDIVCFTTGAIGVAVFLLFPTLIFLFLAFRKVPKE